MSDRAQLLSVATHSSVSELTPQVLEATLGKAPSLSSSQSKSTNDPKDRTRSQGLLSTFTVSSLRLASVPSEWKLRERLVDFFNNASDYDSDFEEDGGRRRLDHALLVLQVDPSLSSQSLLVHT